jgi:hypothetical protein
MPEGETDLLEKFLVPTVTRLAEELSCDRKTIQRYLKAEGNPGQTAEGNFDVGLWRIWVGEQNRLKTQRKTKSKETEELRGLRLQNEKRDLENARMRGESVGLDEAIRVFGEMVSKFSKTLQNSRHTLAPQVVGETIAEATRRIGRAHREALEELSVPEWAKKKPFWSNLFARVCSLHEESLSGLGENGT